ncbi:methionine ABC transporter permease MetI [Sphingobacterium corticibacterium]|uniref:D-methionine transport system permease protein MetI n=1 Tax=Sphingobacterium corticibacterium TaxID=2484746 RepID=A0A4Q6XWU5_9SPHI|nr:methionine ABC transporter permease MetI [Sphingobacterium corticibacterium]RZF61864.1 D-methionine ABC transporter permease MetI [Sphingobacterium corticibacterium]
MSEATFWLLAKGTWETIAMTFSAGFFSFLLGLPLGILLFLTRERQLLANKSLNTTIAFFVNIFRSIPFIILIVWMIPFTRALVGTSIGMNAAIVPLSIGAAPFVARLIENCLLEIPYGIIEAARSMGATTMQIVRKVLIPEALPAIINSTSLTLITLVGYSAMGGAVGAGGLGHIGYQYGYVGYDAFIMNVVLVLLIGIVFGIQFIGDRLSKYVDHRK